jgi:conjugal transfer pilin signal peptidase TrbI
MPVQKAVASRKSLITKMVIVGALMVAGGAWVKGNVAFGVDQQENPSMPCSYYLFLRADPSPNNYQAGEVISFRSDDRLTGMFTNGTLMTKRVIGLPGDRVRVEVDGVWLNDERVAGMPYLQLFERQADKILREYTVADNELFVLGDNENSLDSRYWGTVKQSQIFGKKLVSWSCENS